METNIVKKSLFFILCILFLGVYSCTSDNEPDLPKKGTFPDVKLTNYNGSDFYFKELRGKVLVVSYIYTNCPDICHITSKKLNKFKSQLDQETKNKLAFVSISFDPTRDTPEVLQEHLGSMDLDLDNWYFVTGRRDRVYETLEVAGINPIPDKMESKDSYTFNHRDRISIVDSEGHIRKHLKGSTFDQQELKRGIKRLM